MIKKKLW